MELNELDDDDNKMEIEVQGEDYEHQEQSVQPENNHKNTPYTVESQQDYFGNVDNTPPNNMEETSIASSRPFRSS